VNGSFISFRKLRWTLVFPAIMVSVALPLSYLDKVWLRGAGVWDDMPVTTAQGLAALLIGPSPLIVAKLPARLLGVAAFWTWLGFLLDRRFSGIRGPIIRNVWLRVVLYSLGFIFALMFVREGALHMSHAELDYLCRALRSSSPRRTLLGRELTTVARLLWGVGYTLYFSVKLWQVGRFGKSGAC
jgi:hypothetical protein